MGGGTRGLSDAPIRQPNRGEGQVLAARVRRLPRLGLLTRGGGGHDGPRGGGAAGRWGLPLLDPSRAAGGGEALRVPPLLPPGEESRDRRSAGPGPRRRRRAQVGRDRDSAEDPQRGRHPGREAGHPHLALRRGAAHHARDAVQILVRPGDPEAQGVHPPGASMTDYPEADFARLKTVPITARPNKVDSSLLARAPGRDKSFAAFWDSLPDVLAVTDLRYVHDDNAPAPRQAR